MKPLKSVLTLLIACTIGGYILSAVFTPSQQPLDSLYVSNGEPSPHATILDVPFVHQKPWYCSEASASMVLMYYGYEITQDDIHESGYESFEIMVPLLSQYIDCGYATARIDDLKKEISEGDPVIARISLQGYRHTIVVVGYDEDYLYVNDPAFPDGKNLKMNPEIFMDRWKDTGFAAIIFSTESSLLN